tara:strand:+ start:1560 stop:3491 length:1932 start_codon:yes stop_codon:yes gene_type:complete
MAECANPIGGFTAAWEIIPDQFTYFTNIANGYIQAANEFSQQLADYDIAPINITPVVWDSGAAFTPFEQPTEPADFVAPNPQFTGSQPNAPTQVVVDTSGLDIAPDYGVAPAQPAITIPQAPTVSLPNQPGAAPALSDVAIPTYEGGPLPLVPSLFELDLPDSPDVVLTNLEIDRPAFIPPGALQDDYYRDLDDFRDVLWTGIDAELTAAGIPDVNTRLNAMLAGGTGLPANIEQALFDRAIGRDEVSSVQAVEQAHTEWGARGFDLPGSTLLARVQEIRQANRAERGRINRELSIQFHTQEIENLRFTVQQGIALEGALLEAHTRIYDSARQLADGHWSIAKGIYDSALDIYRLQLEVYRTDIEAFKEKLQIELTKLEVYRSELEAQRVVGQLNEQLVAIYNAELQGVLAGVEVFKAEVSAADSQIRAEQSKLEAYKTQVDAYSARLDGERIKFEIYNTQVGAEETRARVYASQVDAYGKRIDAYRTQVGAEASKIEALTRVEESNIRRYAEQVSAWRSGIEADTRNLQAFVEVYRSQLSKYEALLSSEQYRVTGEARNFELEVQQERTRVEALIAQTGQTIEQMKHITSMGLSATETAAQVNSQLAAASMSAINVGASMSSSNSVSASDSRSCSTNFSGIL